MNCITSRAIILAAGFFLIPFHAAHASPSEDVSPSVGIKMLPPTDPTSSTAAGCDDGSGISRILTWDGASSIKCSDSAKTDSAGDLTINGFIQFETNNIQAGNTCTTEGAVAYDKTSPVHQIVYCNNKLVWAAPGARFPPFPNYLVCSYLGVYPQSRILYMLDEVVPQSEGWGEPMGQPMNAITYFYHRVTSDPPPNSMSAWIAFGASGNYLGVLGENNPGGDCVGHSISDLISMGRTFN